MDIFYFHWTFSSICGIVGVTKEQEVTICEKHVSESEREGAPNGHK